MNSKSQKMQQPTGRSTIVASLKVCAQRKDLGAGSQLHAEIVRQGLLGKDASVASSLINMYAKCGSLTKARQVLDDLPVKDIFSWNALITGYTQHGQGDEALINFARMQAEGVSPDSFTFACILKACGNVGAIEKGQEIHAEIVREGLLQKDTFVGSSLVDMYVNFGLLEKAEEVFNVLPVRDVVSWNALLTGYAQRGHSEEVLSCLGQMRLEGLLPNAITYVCSLKACGSIGAVDKGQQIHAEVAREEVLERNVYIGSALVHMYAKCGSLSRAQEVFNKLLVRDLVSWNALIAGYVQHGHGEEALNCFARMQVEGFSLSAVTSVCLLKACGSLGAVDKGKEIHIELARKQLMDKNIFVGNALVDMYAKFGLLAKAQEVFDGLATPDIVSWNALITGYVQQGQGDEALNCFGRMQLKGVDPDAVTFVFILKACGSIGAAQKGQEIHAEIARKGLLESDLNVGNAVLEMYAKCGSITRAQQVFDKLPVRDSLSWNALIIGYALGGRSEEALDCFGRMQYEGISPDPVTIVGTLKACGSIGATCKGLEIHDEISRKGLLERNIVVGNALMDMYVKCGMIAKAQEVFEKLPVRDIVSWNALIAGYALFGKLENMFYLYDRMIRESMKPDVVTFVTLLNACNHTGLVDEGLLYFESMSKDFCMIPTSEHYTCIVDLLGRAGQLNKVIVLIMRMPLHANLVMWHTVLGACLKWGNVKLARQAFEHAVLLDEKDPSTYVSMTNVYSNAGLQDDAHKVEALRMKVAAAEPG